MTSIDLLPPRDARVAVVVAHPDDETIGAGAHLREFRHLTLVHVTDGAPRNGVDAAAAGFDTPAAYAAARRQELTQALAAGGVHVEHQVMLDCPDQEAVYAARMIVARLADLFAERAIETVLTHPYEGGHPDHDTVAFAVARAAPPRVIEMGGYNALGVGTFIGGGGTEIRLSPEQESVKRRMIDCFVTQARVLASFPRDREAFRPAPRYDFTQPPHVGELNYDRFPWGVDGARWRELIAQC